MTGLNIKSLAIAFAATFPLLAQPATADNIKVATALSVEQAVAKMKGAIEKAGAQVFAMVNFEKGAASVGLSLRPTTQIIFGNPKIGAKAVLDGQTLALYLPLRVLAYEDAEGKVWLMYGDPADAAREHGVASDHPAIKAMQGALKKITGVAAGT